jgi:5-deoxy-glucuronate isomerase
MIIPGPSEFAPGYTPITAIGGPGAEMQMDFGILRLGKGERFSGIPKSGGLARERVFLLLRGAVSFRWNGGRERAERTSMADDLPAALHLPRGAEFSIEVLAGDTELAVIGTENGASFDPRFVAPSEVRITEIEVAAMEGTADRILRTVCDDDDSNLVCGEVVNRAGRWSSYPPHHHPHPEIYHYRFFPQGGFGYCGQGPEVYRVQDGDTAAIAPDLAHPQVAAPGYTMIYVWAIRHLEGNRFGGNSRIFEPEHTWVLDL